MTARRSTKTTPTGRPPRPKNGSRLAVVPLPSSLPIAPIDPLARQRQRILHRTTLIEYVLAAEQHTGAGPTLNARSPTSCATSARRRERPPRSCGRRPALYTSGRNRRTGRTRATAAQSVSE